MRYIARIYRSIFGWMPFSASVTALEYCCGAVIPAAVTVICARLFEQAALALAGGAAGGLYRYAGMYLGVYLIGDLLVYVRSITLNVGVYEKGTAYFRIALYEKLSKLPLAAFEDAALLDRKERAEKAVNDETLSAVFNHSMRFFRAAAQVAGVAAVLAGFSLWLLPLSLVSVLPYLAARVIRGREFYYIKRHQAKRTRRLAYLWSLFTTRQTAKELRVMGAGGYITEKWRETRDEVNEELWAAQKKDALSLLLCDGLRIAGYGASLLALLALCLRGQVSVGLFGAAAAAFLSLQNSMQNFLEGLGRLPEMLSHAADYYAFIDMPDEPVGKVTFEGLPDTIRLENVGFTYPGAPRRAVGPLDLSIRRGEKIAILGENGSGKTTLCKLLLGLYAPQEGSVLYGGVPVGDFEKDGFFARVSAIAQDFVPYSLTLRENVAISDLERMGEDAALLEALAGVGFDEDMRLDDGLGREFGGGELSGGQWQKLAIARGLFRRSELIVLDEPTSALDPLIETEILSAFIRAARGKTAVIVSHRVGLCKLVDRIIVMRDGAVVEDGTHGALLGAGGAYAELYGAQAGWYR